MSFTTPCFIRKNTPELRGKLRELGYKVLTNFSTFPCLATMPDDGIVVPATEINRNRVFDFGDNEELFLALAALRDDTDYMQWFTNGTDFIKCEREYWPDMYFVLCSGKGKDYMNELAKYHKATPTEIIAHFKQKQDDMGRKS